MYHILVYKSICLYTSVSRECHTGIRDLVQDGVNGFLTAMDDKDSFVERCVKLATDIELREEISESARAVCIQYSVGRITDVWEELMLQKRTR